MKNSEVFELCDSGNFEALKRLIEEDPSLVSAKDVHGNQMLHLIVLGISEEPEGLEFLEYLIAKGAQIDARNYRGEQPIHRAVGNWTKPRECKIVKYLINQGAKIDAQDNEGRQPLHFAAVSANLDMVKELLNLGADVDAKNAYGDTPVRVAYYSSSASYTYIPTYLLFNSLNKKDFSGRLQLMRDMCSDFRSTSRFVDETMVKSVISKDLAGNLDGSFAYKDFLQNKNPTKFSSPCDTFDIVSELSGDGAGAFCAASAPSQKPSRKIVILDQDSFSSNGENGVTELSHTTKENIVRSLFYRGFDVYLQSSDGVNFVSFSDSFNERMAEDKLRNPDLPEVSRAYHIREEVISDVLGSELGRFEMNAESFAKLSKLNPSISADEIVKPNLEQTLLDWAISRADFADKTLFEIIPLPKILTLEELLEVQRFLERDVEIRNEQAANKKTKTASDDMARRAAPDHKKMYVAINTSSAYRIDNEMDSGSAFRMVEVGEKLNGESNEIGLRTEVKELKINESGEIFFTAAAGKKGKKVELKKIEESDLGQFRTAQDGNYFRFSTKLVRNKRTRLSSVSSQEELVGVIGDVNSVKIERGDDGFFYATSKAASISYVIKADLENEKNSLPADHPIQRVIDDYRDQNKGFSRVSLSDFVIPKVENKNVDRWLDDLYQRRGGACRHRVAAVYSKIVKEHPEQKENVRILDINNNHVLLEVREDPKSEWKKIDLGGTPSELIYEMSGFEKRTSEIFRDVADGYYDLTESVANKFRSLRDFVGRNIFPDFRKLGADRRKIYVDNPVVTKSNSLENTVDQTNRAKPNPTKVVEQNKVGLKVKEALQKKAQVTQIDDSNEVFQEAKKHKKLLLSTKNPNEAANFLIAKFCDLEVPVFHLKSRKDVFSTRNLNINSAAEATIVDSSPLAKFVAQNQGKKCALIVDWSAFSAKEILALNSLIDEEATVGKIKIPDVSIVSLVEQIPHEPSFSSRHNFIAASDADFKRMPTALDSTTSATEVDLEGFPDWRKKLFGPVKLEGRQIIWEKSDFCRDLESGKSDFRILNISNSGKQALQKELLEAQAVGFFNYYGYEIPLSDNLKIDFAVKNYDFSQFNSVSNSGFKICAKNDVQYSAELPQNIHLVNDRLFDSLIKRNKIVDGEYFESPGLIEENKGQELNLFITSQLSDQQYYCLFNEALRNSVTLNLRLAPDVKLPAEVKTEEIPKETRREQTLLPKPRIFVTNDPLKTLEKISADESFWAVLDVEDYDYKQLFGKIDYSRTQDGYENFREVFSEFAEKLIDGKKIVLKGEFPRELMLVLHPILCSSDPKFQAIRDNLVLIVENKKLEEFQSNHRDLGFLSTRDYVVEHHDLSKKSPHTEFEFQETSEKKSEQSGLENSQQKAREFIHQRTENFSRILRQNSMLQMVGHSGVGKSQLLRILRDENPDYEVYNEMNNFESWANDRSNKVKILFIDESNIEDSHLTKFSPLKKLKENSQNEEPVRILHQGKFFELDETHKVVFARNPLNYSAGRVTQKLFDEDVPVMYLRDFTASYVYEEILRKPIYETLGEEAKNLISEKSFQSQSAEFIAEYQRFNAKQIKSGDETGCETVRELQEKLLNFISAQLNKNPYSETSSDNFVSTAATRPVEEALHNAINIRSQQRAGILGNVHAGLNGFVIEGDPGVGKSEMIKAVLEHNGIMDAATENDGKQKYRKIAAGMSSEQKRKIIVDAFEKGDVVWIDEINSCINDDGLEKVLNAALTGQHPDGKKDGAAAGFMMIASINPPFLSGRSQLSPAIKHRSNVHYAKSLNEYEVGDFERIVQKMTQRFSGEDVVATAQVFHSEVVLRGRENLLTLRELKEVISSLDNVPGPSPSSAEIVAGEKNRLDRFAR